MQLKRFKKSQFAGKIITEQRPEDIPNSYLEVSSVHESKESSNVPIYPILEHTCKHACSYRQKPNSSEAKRRSTRPIQSHNKRQRRASPRSSNTSRYRNRKRTRKLLRETRSH